MDATELSNYHNVDWVRSNADSLFSIIDSEMRDPDTVNQAAERIFYLYPRLMASVEALFDSRSDIKIWARLMDNVLRKLKITPNSRDPIRPEYTLSPLCVIQRVDHTTQVKQKTRRRRFRLNPRQMFETYLILFMYLYLHGEIVISPELTAGLLQQGRIINSQHHYHKLYQLMALVFTMEGSPSQAITLGDMAYAYFKRADEIVEAGLTALILARSHVGQGSDHEAAFWLDIAASQIPKKDYPTQHDAISDLRKQIKKK